VILSTRARSLALALLLGFASLAVALPEPIAAASSSASDRVILGETNTIRGSKARSIEVSVPTDATVSWTVHANPDLVVDGAGVFPGVVLAADTPRRYGPLLIAGRAPADALCSGADCPDTEYVVSTMEVSPTQPPAYIIPRGDYILYLLAYGSPVSVTLTLHGLAGTTEIEPFGPAHLASHLMNPRLAIPAQAAYWDGRFRDMETPGLVFVWSAIVSSYVLNDHMEHCFYSEAPPPPTAHLPTCRGADWSNSFGWTKVDTTSLRHEMTTLAYPVSGEGAGVGYWHVATNPVERTTAFALWLTFA